MKNFFRKEALDSYKNRFSTNNRIFRISLPSIALAVLLIAGLRLWMGWFFTGTVVNSIDVTGVVYPPTGMETVYANRAGTVSSVNVSAGDRVEVGDVLAVVPDTEKLAQLGNNVSAASGNDGQTNSRNAYLQNSFIRTLSAGRVVSVVQKGCYVNHGDGVALIATEDVSYDKNRLIVFLPTENINSIKKGSRVQVSPNYAKREEFGYIDGYVYDIGSEIISQKEASQLYDFYNIPNMLDKDKTYVVVTINLNENEKYKSGLAWSKESSGNIELKYGTECQCSIIVSEQRPIGWLLGGAKK